MRQCNRPDAGSLTALAGSTVTLANERATQRLAVDIAGGAEARRSGHAVGRPRRRQDHLCARADPPSRRRRRSRCRARPSRWCRPTSCRASPWCMPTSIASAGSGELAELGFDDAAGGRGGAARMAGPRRRLPAGRPARHRVHARAAARARNQRTRRAHRLRRIRAAARADRARSASSSPTQAWPTRSACASQGDASTRSYERLTPRATQPRS